jgi:Arc/MetJ-type ribon-helix-helix transcriptional regulator
MRQKREMTMWSIPVTRALDQAVEQAIESDMHVTKSDLVRDAVRQLLKQMDIPVKEATSDGEMQKHAHGTIEEESQG